MRSDRLARIVLAAACVAAAACSEPVSYIKLSLQTSMPAPIRDVVNILVVVTNQTNGHVRTLTYPAHNAMIDMVTVNTLSVDFTSSETGNIKFDVDALNNLGCSMGHGTVTHEIVKGNVTDATVYLLAQLICPNPDAGTPDGGSEGGVVLPGCDVVNPQSTDPSVITCGATQTCQVCGFSTDPEPRNVCVPGGTGGPGTACVTNADCEPGTQCFNYMNGTSSGCPVKLCLRFCNGNADCAAFGAGGGGPGSFCEGPVMCPTVLTSYHTCTFNCDPRAAAAANGGGCPTGLVCVMPASMDQVDCACREPTRTKTEGQACTQATDCAPGLICNRNGTTQTCRPICRCNANSSNACTNTTNDCPTAGTTCRAVTNNTVYGICL